MSQSNGGNPGSSYATASMVCGIISTAISLFLSYSLLFSLLNAALAIVAIILSVKARKLTGIRKASGTAGLVLGIIALCLEGSSLLCLASCGSSLYSCGSCYSCYNCLYLLNSL